MDEGKRLSEHTPAEQLKLWQGRVELARRYQDKFGNTEDRWTKNIKAMAGDFNSRSELGDEAIDVNLVRSTIKTVLPPLWTTEPHIVVTPRKRRHKDRDNVRGAEVTEVEINYWLRELDVRYEVKKALLDAEATNLGYLYVGYVRDKSDVEIDGERTEPVPTIRHRQPFVRRWGPRMVLLPPGFDDPESHPWVDLVSLRPLVEVRKKFGERAAKLKETVSMADAADAGLAASDFQQYMDSDDAKRVEVHNVWDKQTRKVYVFTADSEDFLEDPKPWPYQLEGFPIVAYRPEQVPDEYHATPPISFILPQNKELNAARTAMRKNRNRTKQVIFMDSEVAKEATEAYAKAQDGAIISIPLDGKDIRAVMSRDQGMPLDGSDLAYDGVMKGDVREQSGLGAEQRGSGDPNVDSATASANIEKGVQIRASDRSDGVRQLYLGVAKKLWMILKQFPNEERSRLIAGEESGVYREMNYTLAELEGEYEFDLDFSAAVHETPQTRRTQAILNYNLMRADPLINPERLILDIYRSQNKRDPEAYLLRLRSPEDELQLMLQGLPVEAHERDEHERHLQVHDSQSEQLDQLLRRPLPPEQRSKVVLAQHLLIAHVQNHVRDLIQIQGAGARPPGSPVAENLLRNQVRAEGGSETRAELSGAPLTEAQLVS